MIDADILNLIFLPQLGKITENPFGGSVPKHSLYIQVTFLEILDSNRGQGLESCHESQDAFFSIPYNYCKWAYLHGDWSQIDVPFQGVI